ncbi:MAG: glycosyltransferase [Kiritimatiellae bacterium]|nr:glycosyltransferase [Kiritimatiellia bacterium]
MLSVVIPVYNSAQYLRACLDSLLMQSIRNMEIICVDDGSTDGSNEILSEYAARDFRLKIVVQQNAGQGAARNRGMAQTHGEYVYFMDADDELAMPNALERLVAVVDADHLDALFFDAETRIDEGVAASPSAVNVENYIRRRDYSSVVTGWELLSVFIKNREYTVSPYLVLLRRRFLDENAIRFPDERIFYEDNIFMTRVLLAAKRTSHRPWRLYMRKIHANSTTTSEPTMRHLHGYLACYRDVCDLLSRDFWNRAVRNALRARRRIYKLNVRRLAEKVEMDDDARKELAPILRYPFGERVANAFHCLSERGLFFTIRRILFGRQP